jgi:hypothetical protein
MAYNGDEFLHHLRGPPLDAHPRKHPHSNSARKLYNHHTDPIPIRRAMSATPSAKPDSNMATSSSYEPAHGRPGVFAAHARPTITGPTHG